jgi:hypothetical protein
MGRAIGLLAICAALVADAVQEESYALYSAIYKNNSSLEAGEVMGIAADSSVDSFRENCFKAATREEQEMVDAARAAGEGHAVWERRFDFGREYKLIPSAEKNRAIDCVQGYTHGKPLAGCEGYLKMRFVRFFSVPVYNRDHTRALVEISRVCGGVCGNGSLQVWRKTRAGWEKEVDSFAKCVWQY